MSQTFIIGKDCTVNEVVIALSSEFVTEQLMQKLFDIGIHLKTSGETLRKIRVNLNLDMITISEAIRSILLEWVGRNGSLSTLAELRRVLEANGLKLEAEILREKFQFIPASDRKYCRVPKDLEEFLTASASQRILILSTLDIPITCTKIKQVWGHDVHTFQDFFHLISSPIQKDLSLHFVNATNLKELKEILKLLQIFAKLVVVTNCFEAELQGQSIRSYFLLGSDQIEWDDLTPAFKLTIRSSLESKLGIEMSNDDAATILSGKNLTKLINESELVPFKNTFPKPINYYVNRTLSTRNIISKDVFGERVDIFTISGIQRNELSRLVKSQRTEVSSNLLGQEPLTVRWIILEENHHFHKICKKASKQHVHWLRLDKHQAIRWIQSSGNIKALQKYIDVSQDNLEEGVFCHRLLSDNNSNRPLLICDSPGMGKSILLANIGRQLQTFYPQRYILFLALPSFIDEVKKCQTLDRAHAVDMSLEKLACGNKLEHFIFINKIHSNVIVIELLLDGFDEIDSADLGLANEILKLLNAYQSTRLWVTSRPHKQIELEQILNALSYNILPFSQQDQVYSLTSFWLQNCILSDNQEKGKRLELFANNCLENLKSNLNSKDQDIAGIPLQCFMIGEIFEEDAIDFAKSEGCRFPANQITSISKLYQRLIDVKLNKYSSVYTKSQSSKKELINMHIYLSIKLFFSDQLERLSFQVAPDVKEILRVGIVESSSSYNYPVFIHRTFAEYFIALYATALMTCSEIVEGREVTICEFIFARVLHCSVGRVDSKHLRFISVLDSYIFYYPVIIHFVNSILGHQNATNSAFIIHISKLRSHKSILSQVTSALVSSNMVPLFNLFFKNYTLKVDGKLIFTSNLICLASLRADLELFELVLKCYEEFVDELDSNLLLNLLRAAVTQGKYSIVEYLINEKGLRHFIECFHGKTRMLLHDCVKDSKQNSIKQVEHKLEIIQHLVPLNVALLEFRCDLSLKMYRAGKSQGTPLLSRYANVHLLTKLVELGANVLATDDSRNTFLHSRSTWHMKPEEYHSLVASIPVDLLRELVQVESNSALKRTPLADIIEYIDLTLETMELFKEAGANFNFVDERGDAVLGIGALHGRQASTIRNLIELGANVNYVSANGKSILLRDLEFKDIELSVVETLIEAGADLSYVRNAQYPIGYGLNALGLVIQHNDVNIPILEKLIASGANIKFITKDGYSLLALAIIRGADMEVIRVLIGSGCDIKWRSKWKRKSLLHYAAQYGNIEAVKFLVKEKGIDVNGKSLSVKTPLDYAKKFERIETYEFLVALGGK